MLARKIDIDGNTARSYDLCETVKKVFDDDWKSVNEDEKYFDVGIKRLSAKLSAVFVEDREIMNPKYGKVGGGDEKLEMYAQDCGSNSLLKKTQYGACR